MKKNLILIMAGLSALSLTACTGNLSDAIPDRRPDYRQSKMGRHLEVPPDLSSASVDDQLMVPDFSPDVVASYQAYSEDGVRRDRRGYIEVLPALYGVEVVEQSGELPYLLIHSDASTAWQLVKRYWENNGIRLRVQEPAIGLMETDWLENKADLPKTGLGGLLGGLFSTISDTNERDRYRIQFFRLNQQTTKVVLVYAQSQEVAQYDPMSGKDPAAYVWTLTDNDNPVLQLEMTRRMALYVSAEMRRKAGITPDHTPSAGAGTTLIVSELSTLSNGQPALIIQGEYAQAWRILGIGLDNASFALENQDYAGGAYVVRYAPQADAAKDKRGFWSRLWGSDKDKAPENTRPQYQVRLADQGGYAVAIVQTVSGADAPLEQARAVLEAVQASL